MKFKTWLDGLVEGPMPPAEYGLTTKCWDSTKGIIRNGYSRRGREYAHRATCRWFNGPAPAEKQWALHKCHRPSCCNPEHLYWGDSRQNQLDKFKAGRDNHYFGEDAPGVKLTPEAVREIRSSFTGRNGMELASRYGVDRKTIYNAINCKSWRSVD